MKQFIKDIFSEDTPTGAGKGSGKRFMGIIVGLLAAIGSITTGLHWYEISSDVTNPMWIYSGAMLGVSILKGIMKS